MSQLMMFLLLLAYLDAKTSHSRSNSHLIENHYVSAADDASPLACTCVYAYSTADSSCKPPASPVSMLVRPTPISAFRIEFDLTTETHNNLYVNLSSLLKRTSDPPYDPTDVFDSYVLAKRRSDFDDLLNKWIIVHVKVANEAETNLTLFMMISIFFVSKMVVPIGT
jgi:hypothetical protein